jgi:hypothetical protein
MVRAVHYLQVDGLFVDGSDRGEASSRSTGWCGVSVMMVSR